METMWTRTGEKRTVACGRIDSDKRAERERGFAFGIKDRRAER